MGRERNLERERKERERKMTTLIVLRLERLYSRIKERNFEREKSPSLL